jgi:3-methyl-2-oxobutanoate hydroxymethyltransferase
VSAMTIGIGAGPDCHGQVLVLQDMLGITQGKLPRFVHNFMDGAPSVEEAVSRYVADVRARRYPVHEKHGY